MFLQLRQHAHGERDRGADLLGQPSRLSWSQLRDLDQRPATTAAPAPAPDRQLLLGLAGAGGDADAGHRRRGRAACPRAGCWAVNSPPRAGLGGGDQQPVPPAAGAARPGTAHPRLPPRHRPGYPIPGYPAAAAGQAASGAVIMISLLTSYRWAGGIPCGDRSPARAGSLPGPAARRVIAAPAITLCSRPGVKPGREPRRPGTHPGGGRSARHRPLPSGPARRT